MTTNAIPDLSTLVPLGPLEAFLSERLGSSASPVEITGQPSGGSSNVTLFLRRGTDEFVLRRPPAGELLPTAHDMVREYRFISALWGTDVPVAQPVVVGEDASVIGAPFYLMKRVDGAAISTELPAVLDSPAERRRMGEELIRVLAALHCVDWSKRGITGRPEGYLQRQLARWKTLLAMTQEQGRVLPRVADITRWIEGHIPETQRTTIVHGDYGLHNVLFAQTTPTRLLAVVDWEMATLGDPLADLGWLLRDWGIVPESGIRNPAKELSAKEGFPTATEMARTYQRLSGISVSSLTFYEIFAMWKEVIITEGLYASYLAGNAPNPSVARFETETPEQVQRIIEKIGMATA